MMVATGRRLKMHHRSVALACGAAILVPYVLSHTMSASGQTADKPYDWKTSVASYKVGKVPRTRDGKPDLQGLWSFSILTPLQRPGGLYKEELTEEEAEARENEAQKRQIELRIEPTNTPPGQKSPDAYNTFWRDGFRHPGSSGPAACWWARSEEHTSELQSQSNLVCRLL